jgi:uncharacterized protein YgbK (DUF1537 family)
MDFFLADDLSGALDAAGAFHRAGRTVRIVLSIDAWTRGLAAEGEVVGITTETRNAPPARAAAVVTQAIAHGRAQGGRLVYKKIDSTLRGPVAAELAAVTAAMPRERILFCPANPAAGRTVRDGVLLVRGKPVAETEFARDPLMPVTTSTIRTLLGEAAAERVIIAEAETEADLAAAVARMNTGGEPWMGVGSGALARPVAMQARGAETPERKTPAIPEGTQLMVCGSSHPANREQAGRLWLERGIPIHELALGPVDRGWEAALARLRTAGGATMMMEERRGDSAEVVRMMAEKASRLVAEAGVRKLFVTGGETAFAICERLGISGLSFVAEIEPGLSLSRGEAASGPMALAMKPGGFGDDLSWVRAWDALQGGAT